MSQMTSTRRLPLISAKASVFHFAAILAVAGCGDAPPEFAQVTGTVTLRGKPTKDLQVRFLPNPAAGREIAVAAVGVTDESGRYVLRHAYQGQEAPGAVIGSHRVVVEEVNRPHVPQGQTPPPRKVPPQYSLPGQTPLSAEVQAGEQVIDFNIE